MVILSDVGPDSYTNGVREDFNWIMDGVVLLLLLPMGLLPLNKPNCFYKGRRTSGPATSCRKS
jgi:hypothetical protein